MNDTPDKHTLPQARSQIEAEAAHVAPKELFPFARLRQVKWEPAVPLLFFFFYLFLGWRNWDVFNKLPSYGDALEVVWGLHWYESALFGDQGSPFFTPLLFHPEGWFTTTLAETPYFFLATLPLSLLGGSIFAYNVVALGGLTLGYAGMYVAARRFGSCFLATLAAVAYAFSYPFYIRSAAHLSVLGGAALMPWLLWAVVRTQQRGPTWGRVLGVGLIYGLSISFSLYYLFLGGLVLLVGLIFPVASDIANKSSVDKFERMAPRYRRFVWLMVAGIVAALFNLPIVILFFWAREVSQTAPWSILHLSEWGMSLNTIVIPPLTNPWLYRLGELVYQGEGRAENVLMGLGVVVGLLALYSLRYLRQIPGIRLLAAIFVIGVILGLGIFLRWDEQIIAIPALIPLNRAIWQLGYTLRPELFIWPEPPGLVAEGIPLPNLLLVIFVPFWSGIRTVSRFGFLIWLAAPILAAIALSRIRFRVLRYLLIGLWLVEAVPVQIHGGLPMPAIHPAYEWLAEQELLPGYGILDLRSVRIQTDGSVATAAEYHGKPTVSGVGSQWPRHFKFLDEWYLGHETTDPDFGSLLRAYAVQYLFFHMDEPQSQIDVRQMIENPDFSLVDCFFPSTEMTAWPWEICVVAVEQPAWATHNVFFREGWYDEEPWGIWASGQSAKLEWVATESTEYDIVVEAFPLCVPGREQWMGVSADGQSLGEHIWTDCEPWRSEIAIPAELVNIGWNALDLSFAYATRPSDITDGTIVDPRALSVGFSRLEVLKGSER